jgi:hypothetical protein
VAKTNYRTITLDRAKQAVKVYNEGVTGGVKNPYVDEQAIDMFLDGLGLTKGKIERQVEFIGDKYEGAGPKVFVGAPVSSLAERIADSICAMRTEYERAVVSAPPILLGIVSREAVELLYRPFILEKNWHVWFTKFCFWLNQSSFPMEDSRVDEFFLITDGKGSADKYLKFANLFRNFVLSHQGWVPELRKVDDGSDSQPCSENKLWDKMCYGIADLEKSRRAVDKPTAHGTILSKSEEKYASYANNAARQEKRKQEQNTGQKSRNWKG